jgi:hypothetical protein
MLQRSKKNPFRSLIASESGLTLIDTSIILVIVGLLMIPVVAGLKLMHKQEASRTNDTNFYTIAQSLENFYSLNGYYPCPADPTLGPDDANYGQPNIVGGGVVPTGGADCIVPTSADGIAIEGALPFKALKITAKEALDGWSNKITYAVTTSQTRTNTFLPVINLPATGITIQDNRATCGITGTPITRDNYHFVFFSHGQNGAGAYNPEGNLVQTCLPTTPGAPAPAESENCDGDRTYIYDLCMKSDVQNAGYYDDEFYRNAGTYNRLPSKMWAKGTDPNNIGSRGVFVGVNNFEARHELDVKGNVMVQHFESANANDKTKKGQTHAQRFCDGALCTKAEIIAGSVPAMQCAGGKGMAGIGSNKAKCSNSTTAIPPQGCELGQFVIGIGNGQLICGGP